MIKKIFFVALAIISMLSVSGVAFARGRYGSTRVGGYTSSGKGSHYVGGYIRSCHGLACR